MTHLDPADIVDVVDGCAGEPLRRHADSCEACRAAVEDARLAARLAASDQMPEPSPLFWAHFSERVVDATRRLPEPRRGWAGLAWWWRALPVAAVLVVAVAAGLTRSPRHSAAPVAGGAGEDVAQVHQTEIGLAGLDDDEPWALLFLLMAEAEADGTASQDMPAFLGSADRVLESLSDGEKAELTRLLKAELDVPGVLPD